MGPTIALIVGAGRGHRFGGEIPKQYLNLGGTPLLRRTVRNFSDHPDVDAVRGVIHPDDRKLFNEATKGLDLLEPVAGGASRQASVRLGLESLTELSPGRVLIHDAARPFPGADLISRVLTALESSVGAIPGLAVTDTVKRAVGGVVETTVDRSNLWRVQTPQGFRFDDILEAHRATAEEELTDDAAVAEHQGLPVAMVDGNPANLKVTTPDDLLAAERQLHSGISRTGMGFDVHRFTEGDGVMLCGVFVPHDRKLEGHSDADVGLHALTDAILGAIGGGDIGHHFPPSEEVWRGAPSHLFLEKAAALARQSCGEIVNVDITLICQLPKIGPHRENMVARVAEILDIERGRVNIKATTTEGLGFTGRGEGIAAQAVANVVV